MKKNSTGVSVRNLSPFRTGFKLKEIRKFIIKKCFIKTLLNLLHSVGFSFILVVRTALMFCVTGAGELGKANKSFVTLKIKASYMMQT